MQGAMLAPRASKRTVLPRFRSSRLRASKLAESGELSVIEMDDFFYGALVGLEGVAIAGNGICELMEKAKRGVDVPVMMEGDEAASEELAYGLTWGETSDDVAEAVLQNKDALQGRALG